MELNPEESNTSVIQERKFEELHKITPLSKYLALFLFTILPFLGAWIGYLYAPEKVIEIEKIVYKEVQTIDNNILIEELSPYEEREARIEKLKSDPNLMIDNVYDLQSVVSFEERKNIYASARGYVNSVSGIEFSLVFDWKKGDWIKFTVIPENVETDNAQLFMHKENDKWSIKGFGTAFPELYEEYRAF